MIRSLSRRELLKLLALLPFSSLAACSPRGPEKIRYGEDSCEYCQMMTSDPRYGAEIITKTGKVHKFDSVECMIGYGLKYLDEAKIQSRWVTDFHKPESFIVAEDAFYLQSTVLRSPMIVGLTAFASETALDAAETEYSGQKLSYSDLARVVKEAKFA